MHVARVLKGVLEAFVRLVAHDFIAVPEVDYVAPVRPEDGEYAVVLIIDGDVIHVLVGR